MARQNYELKEWWYAKEAQLHLSIGYVAFIRLIEAEGIRTRHLPGAAYPQYHREDVERAAAKYVTVGAPRVKGKSGRPRKPAEQPEPEPAGQSSAV